MLLFAHPGITLGAATILADAVNRKPSWFVTLSRYLDIRWLLVGSLLPDIIDKPIGQYIFRDTFNNGRIFSHTLLFLIVISAIGFYLFKKQRRVWLLAIAAGVFVHLVLDEMWQTPVTLLWPFMGFSFPAAELEDWARNIWDVLFSDPRVYVPEIVGLIILFVLLWLLVRRKKVLAFIKYGKVA